MATTQESYRFRTHDNASLGLNSTTFGVAANTGITVDFGRRYRLRIVVTSDAAFTSNLKLQRQINAGAFADVFINAPGDSENTRVGIDDTEIVANSGYADQDATTEVLGGTGTFVAGDGMDTTITSGSISINNQFTELEWSLWHHEYTEGGVTQVLADGDTVTFRVVQSDNTPLTTYSASPTVTLSRPDYNLYGGFGENPGHLGPWEDSSGNRYMLVEADGVSANVFMLKSTNGGITWTIPDKAGAPTAQDLEGIAGTLSNDGHSIHLAHWTTDGTDRMVYHRFNMSTHGTPDDWAEIDTIVDNSAAVALARDQQATIERMPGGDDLIIGYSKDTAPWKVVARRRVSGVWDTSDITLWNVTSNDILGPFSCIDPDTGTVYFFAHSDTTGIVYGKALTTGNTLQDLFGTGVAGTAVGTSVTGNTGTSLSEEMNGVPPLFWDDAGTNYVWFMWSNGANADELEGRRIQVGSGGSLGTIREVSSGAEIGQNAGSSRMPQAGNARHPTNGEIHVWYAKDTADGHTASALFHRVSTDDGATWSVEDTDSDVGWGSTPNWIRANYLATSNVIAVVYHDASDYEEDTSETIPGDLGILGNYNWYAEIVFDIPFTGLIIGSD